jgi:S-adenosylmethionine:tRNA ribosyltransferase-isomerase
MHPKEISIQDYTYELPQEKIARQPLEQRDKSNLLVYQQGIIRSSTIEKLPENLDTGDLLIFNQSRVIQARLFFKTEAGAKIEVFCLEPADEKKSIQDAMSVHGKQEWICMVGNARKWKQEETLRQSLDSGNTRLLEVNLIEKQDATFRLSFSWPPQYNFAELLERVGLLPIPPYLNREAVDADQLSYQTVYAKDKGSVAAPTAGLHFTEDLMDKLERAQIETAFLTLHVGAGTFKPVKADTMEGHDMHQEEISISQETLAKLIACKGRIVAVGTTSLRSLESIYWTAVRLMKHPETTLAIDVKQWEPYSYDEDLPDWKFAFSNLLNRLQENQVNELKGKSGLLIAPSYKIRTIDGLLTNFHQPKSTLLLLIAACIGEDWREVYGYALKNDYRFLSYGDASLLFLAKNP